MILAAHCDRHRDRSQSLGDSGSLTSCASFVYYIRDTLITI